ncbi:MAG: tail fiber protein [Verrucomicrobiota bacterium]
MSEPFIGEIRMFGFDFAPRSWAKCDGQELAINRNQSLFSLILTVYGGDGRTSFALPDLRQRFPMHVGSSTGLTIRTIGEKSGVETNTLTTTHLPTHSHSTRVKDTVGDATSPVGNLPSIANDRESNFATPSNGTPTGGPPTQNSGSGQSLTNMPPFLVINFCIALDGTFPSRN